MIRARVFENKTGDRFLIPGFWYSDDDPALGMGDQVTCLTESMLFAVVLGAKPVDWIDVEVDATGNDQVPHVRGRFVGPQFAHGAIDVLLIAGPMFEESQR